MSFISGREYVFDNLHNIDYWSAVVGENDLRKNESYEQVRAIEKIITYDTYTCKFSFSVFYLIPLNFGTRWYLNSEFMQLSFSSAVSMTLTVCCLASIFSQNPFTTKTDYFSESV